MSRQWSRRLIWCLIRYILKPTLEEPLDHIWCCCVSRPNMYSWPLGVLRCSGCLACRYLATAKAGNQACCMDFERDFRMLPHRQDGPSCFWFVSLAPFPKGGTCSAQLCAGWHIGLRSWAESFSLRAVCPQAGLQAVQRHAGDLKSTVPCMWLNRNMKMLLKKGRTQLGTRWNDRKRKTSSN